MTYRLIEGHIYQKLQSIRVQRNWVDYCEHSFRTSLVEAVCNIVQIKISRDRSMWARPKSSVTGRSWLTLATLGKGPQHECRRRVWKCALANRYGFRIITNWTWFGSLCNIWCTGELLAVGKFWYRCRIYILSQTYLFDRLYINIVLNHLRRNHLWLEMSTDMILMPPVPADMIVILSMPSIHLTQQGNPKTPIHQKTRTLLRNLWRLQSLSHRRSRRAHLAPISLT
jgi:hypothetical protein